MFCSQWIPFGSLLSMFSMEILAWAFFPVINCVRAELCSDSSLEHYAVT